MDLIKRLAGLLAVTASCSAVGAPLLFEGFDDITTLAGKGWLFDNRSAPPGSTSWFQGNPSIFAAAAGAADSYIAANFNGAAYAGSIDNWLFTPQLQLVNGEALNFSLRLLGEGALDRVEVYLDTGASYALLAGFEADADTGWRERAVLVSGLTAPATGRFGFRYVVDDTSLNGNYIGIDSVSVSAIPEPATVALVCLGAIALRRRKQSRRHWPALVGLSVLAVAAHAGETGNIGNTGSIGNTGTTGTTGVMRFPHVTVVSAPAAPSPPESGGLMAYKDPLTGQLTRPNAKQAALLTAAARAHAPLARQAPPSLTRPPHGGVSLMLDERHARYAVIHKAADGDITATCTPATGERP